MRMFAWLLTLIITLFSVGCFARDVMHSAVGNGYINGLQAKYLKVIAQHLDMDIDIVAMPYARRLRALEQGDIDILVGMAELKDNEDTLLYIQPSYETIRYSFFVKQKNHAMFASFDDFKNRRIGITRHVKYFQKFEQESSIIKMDIPTVRQKIKLLNKERIDSFIQVQDSAFPIINDMGLQDQIVLADYQPVNSRKFYVVLSKRSSFVSKADLVEEAIRLAIDTNEFSTIRQVHYQGIRE